MLNIEENRQYQTWSYQEKAKRVLWTIISPAFFLSPRLLWGWRCWLLRLFGAKIGLNVHIHPNVRISIPWNLDIKDYVGIGDHAILYALGPVKIGSKTTISQNAHLCAGTHDYTKPALPLVKAPITIGESCWICADAFIGPNVIIGDKTIVGARAVVMKSIENNIIVAGNPARKIKAWDIRN